MDWIAPVIIVACSFISLGWYFDLPGNFRGPPFFFAGSFSSGGFLLSLVQSCKVISILEPKFGCGHPSTKLTTSALLTALGPPPGHSIIRQSYSARYRRSRSRSGSCCAALPQDIVKDPWVQLLPAFPALSSLITSFIIFFLLTLPLSRLFWLCESSSSTSSSYIFLFHHF
ncbi:uncharacterized protein BO96DRAFT_211324 [Aspergillus niger CBS 101883]|uniref:uncharacterized protein n=1 Tax=Aspergillus lacticoffeatus (strain CBS 101883) TaxID=1450533 RepID=UPI000D7FB209|nr:uncharacterized protein BO96DRAFT_211324 [Aspergillus niger CBS 101883]PYH59473.1 hypothetical protein BO96DRAFT_211324 [Aspergillus niger CBS 101883]